ncbi:MAG: hypothetical protein V1716_04325 [Candidatus Uhrbacteria bacterium]
MFKGIFGGNESGQHQVLVESHEKPSASSDETRRLFDEMRQLEKLGQPTDMTGAELIGRIRMVVEKDLEATKRSNQDYVDRGSVSEVNNNSILMLENRLAVLDEVAKDTAFATKQIRVQPSAFTDLTGPLFRSGEMEIRPDNYLSELIRKTKSPEEERKDYENSSSHRIKKEVSRVVTAAERILYPDHETMPVEIYGVLGQAEEIALARIIKKLKPKGGVIPNENRFRYDDYAIEKDQQVLDDNDIKDIASFMHDAMTRAKI